jgi:acyl-CoA reductase-like NAD-dependent aldehyde dehydrogenase
LQTGKNYIQQKNYQKMKTYQYYAGGVWRDAENGRTFDDLEPYSGKIYAKVAAGSRNDMKIALSAAAEAFPAWAATTPAQRAELLFKAAAIIKRRRTEIAEILAKETGSTISFATFQQDLLAGTLEMGAGWAYEIKGEVLQSNVPGSFSIGVRRPLGVVASFTPWNGASILSWRTVISPIVAGNTVVVKPSEFAPVSAGLMIAEIAHEAGFPPGVINVVTHAPGEAGGLSDEIFDNPNVRVINLIGGVKTANTIIGPLINEAAIQMVEQRIKDAVSKGAKIVAGGTHEGPIFHPTILTEVPYDAIVSNEETFGPVVIVEAVDTPEEAVAVANRVSYGLVSSIFTNDTYKGFELAPKILHGVVNVNSPTVNEETQAPMGGVKDSGWGRTGPHSLEDFTDLIWINARSTQRQYPF